MDKVFRTEVSLDYKRRRIVQLWRISTLVSTDYARMRYGDVCCTVKYAVSEDIKIYRCPGHRRGAIIADMLER